MDRTGVALSIVFGFPFRDQGLCRVVNDYVLEAVAVVAGAAGRVWPASRRGSPGRSPSWSAVSTAGCAAAVSWPRAARPRISTAWRRSAGLLRERGSAAAAARQRARRARVSGEEGASGPAACVACAAAYPGSSWCSPTWAAGAFLYEAMPEVRRHSGRRVLRHRGCALSLRRRASTRRPKRPPGRSKLLFGSDYALLSPAPLRGRAERAAPAARAAVCWRQRTKGLQAMSHAANHGHDSAPPPRGAAVRRPGPR